MIAQRSSGSASSPPIVAPASSIRLPWSVPMAVKARFSSTDVAVLRTGFAVGTRNGTYPPVSRIVRRSGSSTRTRPSARRSRPDRYRTPNSAISV
jgi:hypothetical protein